MEKFIEQGYLTQAEECYILMLRAGVKSNIGLGTKYMDLYASVGYLDKATRHLTRDIFTNNEWKASLDEYLTLIKRISNEYKREDLPARTRIQHANQLVAYKRQWINLSIKLHKMLNLELLKFSTIARIYP